VNGPSFAPPTQKRNRLHRAASHNFRTQTVSPEREYAREETAVSTRPPELHGMTGDRTNTIVFPLPMDLMEAMRRRD
jgi:hypothetical protein